jgi:macrophage erythroblast attacher
MKKHMAGSSSPDIPRAAALLVYPPDTSFEPYKVIILITSEILLTRLQTLFSQKRWDFLASTFVETHNSLLSLPSKPPLQIALVAGLSALKTPTCHSADRRELLPSGTSLCPICSTELNDLARGVPYAHHTRSSVEPDPVVLPNGRIYGQKRLLVIPQKGGKENKVRDPITGEEFPEASVSKVFIS